MSLSFPPSSRRRPRRRSALTTLSPPSSGRRPRRRSALITLFRLPQSSRPRLARRTVRLRLTLLHGGLLIASGAWLLAITYLLILHYSPTEFVATTGPNSEPAMRTTGPTRLGSPSSAKVRQSAHWYWTGLDHLVLLSAMALAIVAALSFVVGWLAAGRTLRPLAAMTDSARRISERNLHERLAVPGPSDELKDLGDTIDGLLDRLETVVSAQRQFAANASHELRTPITVQRTLLESVLTHPQPTPALWRTTCQRVLASSEKQARLIEALLVLARSQQELGHRETFDLAPVTASVMRALAPDASARGLTVSTELEACPVSGDARLVERLVWNLGQNAIRHNRPQGRVHVAVGARSGRASLQVSNTGPPVPGNQISRLLQPFQRLGPQRSGRHDGSGLGLSIADAIAKAHGATLTARPGAEGGLDIEVTFPRPPTAGVQDAGGMALREPAGDLVPLSVVPPTGFEPVPPP
jgi:signal transduction histidine kinase